MSISLIKQNNKAIPSNFRLKSQNSSNLNEQIKEIGNNKEIAIKTLQTKFILYLDQLNSSIQNCKKKTFTNSGKSLENYTQCQTTQDYSCSSYLASGGQELQKSSRKTHKSQKKKGSKLYRVLSGNYSTNNGKLNGQVVLELQSGSKFEGQVIDGQIAQGTMNFQDGTVYKGGFKNMMFHGYGQLKLPHGTQYKVDFYQGIMQRKGQIRYVNGDIYKGQIQKYKKHGYGELKLKNGSKYEGNFFQGQIQGYGIYYVNGFPSAIGIWHKGQYMGKNYTLKDEVLEEKDSQDDQR